MSGRFTASRLASDCWSKDKLKETINRPKALLGHYFMLRSIILLSLVISAVNCRAGFFEYSTSSFDEDQFFNTVNNDADPNLGVGDIVRSVVRFTYTDTYSTPGSALTRTALGISIAEVGTETSAVDGRTLLQMAAPTPTGSTGTESIADFITGLGVSNASSIINLEATPESGTDVYALLSTAGDVSLSATGFDFTAANFGLTASDWSVDATAAFSGGNYQAFYQDYLNFGFGDITAGLDMDNPDANGSLSTGSNTFFTQQSGYTITQVRDDRGTYEGTAFATIDLISAGDAGVQFTYSTANLGSEVANLQWVSDSDLTSPTGTELRSTSVSFSLPAPGAVPEPSAFLVMSGIGLAGLLSRRRREGRDLK